MELEQCQPPRQSLETERSKDYTSSAMRLPRGATKHTIAGGKVAIQQTRLITTSRTQIASSMSSRLGGWGAGRL